MRIDSSQILLTANHALTEKHTRQETLVAGVSSTGAWNAAAREGDGLRPVERRGSLPPMDGSRAGGTPTLLDEYLGGRSLEHVEQRAAALRESARGSTSALPAAADATGEPGSGTARSDLAALERLLRQDGGMARLQELAGLVADGGIRSPGMASRASAPESSLSGLGLPDLDVLRQGLAQLGSHEGGDLLSRLFTASLPLPLEGYASLESQTDPQDRLKMELIRATVSALTGRNMRLLEPADLNLEGPTAAPAARAVEAYAEPVEGEAAPAPSGPAFGLSYSLRETHYESETTTFEAKGQVQTADGQQIEVDVSLTMGRQFYSEESLEVRAGAALQDPLVVNFEGTAAELTERTYAFDLDTDGQAEQIHFVGPNSGFLAYDRNGNGAVDDGSELFGPATGQGFAELSNYDEDGNNFIDEGDSVYEGLRVWQKDTGGNDRLIALGQAGVGAIYLGHTDTPFQVKDADNQLQGVVRSSGLYLKEDGGSGTVQQLDLVV